MALRFRKRASPAPSSTPPDIPENLPSSEELRRRLLDIEAQLADAHTTVEVHALAAVAGNEHAKSLVSAANAKTGTLAAELATLRAALRQVQQVEPQQREYLRRRGNFLRNKYGWVLHLQQHVPEEYGRLAAHLILLRSEDRPAEIDLWWSGGNRQDDPPGVKNVARDIARRLIEPLVKTRRAYATGDPNRTAYRDEVDQKLLNDFIEELLKEADLPECPTTIELFTAKYYQLRVPGHAV